MNFCLELSCTLLFDETISYTPLIFINSLSFHFVLETKLNNMLSQFHHVFFQILELFISFSLFIKIAHRILHCYYIQANRSRNI